MSFTDIETTEPGLKRILTGLYVYAPNAYYSHCEGLLEGWHEFRHEYPEYRGADVDARMSQLKKEFDANTFYTEYGSCDSPEQFAQTDLYRILKESEHQFLVTFRPLAKEQDGGYRWHKNGPYIGEKDRKGYEYLADEPNIDKIYQFRIYRKP